MWKQAKEIISRINEWRKQNPFWFLVALVGLVIFVFILIETIRQGNTGLEDKSLWDWLDLIIVSLIVALALFWLNTSQKKREDKRDTERQKQEEQRQTDSQQQSTLQAYYDKMSELLLEKGLGAEDGEVSETAKFVARALTLSAFRYLDPGRNAAVLRFLGDAGLLIGERLLRDLDMKNVNFSKANLIKANLSRAHLTDACLSGTDLHYALLGGTNLLRVDLSRANLRYALLPGAYLVWTNLNGANLSRVNLSGADLTDANLNGADLTYANLSRADLTDAYLSGTDLREAQYTEDTMWPYGFNPKVIGAILVDNEGNPIEDLDEEE